MNKSERMSRNRKRVKSVECPNCHIAFADDHSNFCPNCGQENHTHKLPVKHFLIETVEAFTHFDTKSLTTVRDLILSPGLVIQKYNENKRARYVPPIRLYAFTSFLFFLFLAFSFSSKVKTEAGKLDANLQGSLNGQINFIHKTVIDSTLANDLTALHQVTPQSIDSLLQVRGVQTDWFNTRLVGTMTKLHKAELSTVDIYQKIVKSASYAVFILMPIFALVLMLFYRRRNYYYSEFLVFSIYLHTFLFWALSVVLTVFRVFDVDIDHVKEVMTIIATPYLYLSIKKVFGQSVSKTLGKTILIGAIYSVLLVVLSLILVMASLI
jgi:Protein of unknown function (DUF3667)